VSLKKRVIKLEDKINQPDWPDCFERPANYDQLTPEEKEYEHIGIYMDLSDPEQENPIL